MTHAKTETNSSGRRPPDHRTSFHFSGDFYSLEQIITHALSQLSADVSTASSNVISFESRLERAEQQITNRLHHQSIVLKDLCARLEHMEDQITDELNRKNATALLQLIADIHPDLDDAEFREFNLRLYEDYVRQLGLNLIIPKVNKAYNTKTMRPAGLISQSDSGVWTVTSTVKFGLRSDNKVLVQAEVKVKAFNSEEGIGVAA